MLDVCAVIAAALLGMVMVFVSVSVLSRYFFDNPMAWVIETSEYALLYSTLLGSAWLLRRDGHTKVDIVLNLVSPRRRALMNTYTSVLGFAACLALLYYSSLTTYSNYERGLMLVKIFQVPKFVPLLVIPLGSLLLTIQFARRAVGFYHEFQSIGREEAEPKQEPATESYNV